MNKHLIFQILVAFGAFLHLNAAIGQSAVTDIDMKNAYCMRVKINLLATVQPIIQHFESTGNQNIQEIKTEYGRVENDLKRIRTYFAIRANVVGASQYANAIVPVTSSADQDIHKTNQCSSTCGNMTDQNGKPNFSKMEVCSAKCEKENKAIIARFRSCDVVNWLPF